MARTTTRTTTARRTTRAAAGLAPTPRPPGRRSERVKRRQIPSEKTEDVSRTRRDASRRESCDETEQTFVLRYISRSAVPVRHPHRLEHLVSPRSSEISRGADSRRLNCEKIRFADSSGLSRCEIEASRGKRPKKRPGRITGPTRRRATLTMVVHFFVTDT